MIQLSFHITTRLEILPIIYDRINEEYEVLMSYCKKKISDKNKCSRDKDGFVLEIEKSLVYSLILDIDSFLFEINSSIELITKFVMRIYNLLGRFTDNFAKEMKEMLLLNGCDISWFRLLDSGRNYFIHDGTPFIAIDCTNEEEGYDLIIMKENLKSFEGNKTFYRFSEFTKIAKGFYEMKNKLSEYLFKIIESKQI